MFWDLSCIQGTYDIVNIVGWWGTYIKIRGDWLSPIKEF